MDSGTASLISLCVTSATALGLAWIAYKQAQIGKNMQTLKEQTNHIKDALVAATAEASKAAGKLEGRQELKAEQAAEKV